MADERSTPPMRNPAEAASVLTPAGLVSIIVPCCGMLEYTKLCVPTVLRRSRSPFELIFVDIGSLDGTADYLAGIAAAASVRVEIVRTPTDQGIAAACKEAIRQARGEYLVLLNNDTVVPDGWLSQLTAMASLSAGIGLVGPVSNHAAPPQGLPTVPYRITSPRPAAGVHVLREGTVDLRALAAFAREVQETNKGKWVETERLGGFCLLMKRHVFDRVSLDSLDRWTALSLFDTDVLSVMARNAGFTLACCKDLFVHHFGTRVFAQGAPSATHAG